jgi:hypothetical protein
MDTAGRPGGSGRISKVKREKPFILFLSHEKRQGYIFLRFSRFRLAIVKYGGKFGYRAMWQTTDNVLLSGESYVLGNYSRNFACCGYCFVVV